MTGTVAAGSWVEIGAVVLAPGERAPQVPEDTRAVPLELRAKGVLAAPARIGERAEIRTAAGRRLAGTLVAVNPAYGHGFGAPVPALADVGREARALLKRAADAGGREDDP
ncbi:MAG: 2-amino-4-oxopentanoate thiolase subunit OrtA [Gammaproteobacteria bacterium]|nr:2-amino-4-oxopentanoate thiolase subunit OrtA [Gammaproteobacteria bacterium]